MKKILHILVLPQMAGSQRISLEILKNLPDDEFEKHVLFGTEICGEKREECQRLFEAAGAKVIYLKTLKRAIGLSDFQALISIYKLCRQYRYDIVHTHSTKPGIIGRIGARLARVPNIIHTVHGLSFHDYVKFPKWQFYWLCEMFASLFCDRIVLVNRYYAKYFRWFKSKTSTIYNGVDFSRLSTPSVFPQQNETSSVNVLSVGRLDTQKDPLTLLKAAQIVIRQAPNVHFTIVGNGELYADCERFIRENDLNTHITLAGWQDNVQPFYATHDIFALTSIYESFGLIFVEAGFHYLPTVATNVEGIPEVIKNEVTGLLTNPHDYEGTAKKILQLVLDSRMRTDMGRKAHEWVTSQFTIDRMVRGYVELYNIENR